MCSPVKLNHMLTSESSKSRYGKSHVEKLQCDECYLKFQTMLCATLLSTCTMLLMDGRSLGSIA